MIGLRSTTVLCRSFGAHVAMNVKRTHGAVLRADFSVASLRSCGPHATMRLDPQQSLKAQIHCVTERNARCLTNAPLRRNMSLDQEQSKTDTKTLLRKLLLRVHPDRMADSPNEQRTNEKSLAELNAFLDQVDTISGQGDSSDGTRSSLQPIKLRFYVSHGEAAKRRVIEHDIVVPDRLIRPGAKRDWRMFGDYTLAVLFHLAGIEMSSAWTKLATSPIQSALSGQQPSPAPSVDREKSLEDIMREAVQALHDAPDIAAPVFSLDEDQNDRSYFLRTAMLHYDKRLTFNQKLKATSTFLDNLAGIAFRDWKTVPIVISDKYHNGPPGFVTVPWDFTVASFIKYIRRHGPAAANTAIADLLPPGYDEKRLSQHGAVDPHIFYRQRRGMSHQDKKRRSELLSKEFSGLKRPLRSHTARPGDTSTRRR